MSLIVFYVGSFAVIEARRSGWLPAPLTPFVSDSHFVAIGIAFYLLVLAELVGLIFSLADSVARSVGKQVEILSLILLRGSFETLSEFAEPIPWGEILSGLADSQLTYLIIDAVTALLIFVMGRLL